MSEKFVFRGAAEIIEYQSVGLFDKSQGVKDLLSANVPQTTFSMAFSMYQMGYIEGKRAERARRKASKTKNL